jgi:hypothetical protein
VITRDPLNRTWFLDVGRVRLVLDLSPDHRRWPVHISL